MKVTVLVWNAEGDRLFVSLPPSGTQQITLDGCSGYTKRQQLPAAVAVSVARRLLSGEPREVERVAVVGDHWLYAVRLHSPMLYRVAASRVLADENNVFARETVEAVRALQAFVQQSAA